LPNYGPSIVTDNLLAHYDAANPLSYPGAGATWFDLSGNGYNVTMFGSPTHTRPIAGKSLGITLAGGTSGQYMRNTTMPNGHSSFTVEVIFFHNGLDQNGSYGVVSVGSYAGPMYYNHTSGTGGHYFGNNVYLSGLGWSNYQWNHYVGTYDDIKTAGLRPYKLYRNNSLLVNTYKDFVAYGVPNGSGHGVSGFLLGNYSSGSSNVYKGSFGIFRFYDKVLTVDEIDQNFQATRSRFGL